MWTIDDLKRAVERRREHLQLAPDAERVILAAERASGRTEETVNPDTAKRHLLSLLAVLDIATVPEHLRHIHPALAHKPAPSPQMPARPAPTQSPPQQRPTPATPAQTPPPLPKAEALKAELNIAEAGLKVGDKNAPVKVVNLEPQPINDRARSTGGPSR